MSLRTLGRATASALWNAGQQAVALLPDDRTGSRARYCFYRRQLKSCGGRFHSLSGLKIFQPELVRIGSDVSMNIGVVIDPCSGGPIDIGDGVMIGPYSVLRVADHRFDDPAVSIRLQGHVGGPIIIEEDCWLGSHCVVLKNVRIGKGSVIGAHSVVTRDIPPGSIAVGAPARVTRTRASARPEQLRAVLAGAGAADTREEMGG